MNIFEHYKNIFLKSINNANIDNKIKKKISVEIPKQKIFGDISFNAPLILGSFLKKSPLVLAEKFRKSILNNSNDFEKIEIVKPGFINFTLKSNVWFECVKRILELGIEFGSSNFGKDERINIEYVSANPTGPLHVGHGRGAALGSALAHLLKHQGYEVDEEYYLNNRSLLLNIKIIILTFIKIFKKRSVKH